MSCCPIATPPKGIPLTSTSLSMSQEGNYLKKLGEDRLTSPFLLFLEPKLVKGDRFIDYLLGQFAIKTFIKIPSPYLHLSFFLEFLGHFLVLLLFVK